MIDNNGLCLFSSCSSHVFQTHVFVLISLEIFSCKVYPKSASVTILRDSMLYLKELNTNAILTFWAGADEMYTQGAGFNEGTL